MFKLLKISGNSLYPFFKDGQRVLCRKLYANSTLRVNDTVVIHKKPYGLIAKKITIINLNKFYLRGNSPDSIDSRDFGYIDKEDLKYKILCKLSLSF
ncbi:MAG TPA: hypothetical protein EYP02_07015 [Sulfurovum sp.]|nr:hypothetical protein [Sulfurovum sp.]